MKRQSFNEISLHSFKGQECACVRYNMQSSIHLVHSEGFRECCDIVIDYQSNTTHPQRDFSKQLTQQALMKLAPSIPQGTTIHLRSCELDFFFGEIFPQLKHPIILVSGDTDTTTVKGQQHFLSDHRLFHWFTQNCGIPGNVPKVTRIPIGIDNPIYTKMSKRAGFVLMNLKRFQPFESTLVNERGNQPILCEVGASMKPIGDKPLKVLCTFHQFERLIKPNLYEKGREPRLEAYLALKDNPNCFFPHHRLAQRQCWQIHEEFAFEASPHGKGLDCHRTWEALFLQTIPIVKTSALDQIYRDEGFPVAIVKDWDEITGDNLRQWYDELRDRFNQTLVEKLSMKYWQEKIQAKKQECLQN